MKLDEELEWIKTVWQVTQTTKYLRFDLQHKSEKTHHWTVSSLKHGDLLGIVKWYGAWRGYAFYPEPQTVFNEECLGDIESFIEQMNEHHRRRRELRKLREGGGKG